MEEPRTKKIRYFDDDRLWFTKKSGVLTMGITQTCLDEIGTVESLHLPDEGDELDKGDVVCEIFGSEGSIEVTSPAAGFIVEVNTSLEDGLAPLNEDPDGEGWILRMEYQDEMDLREYEG